ncbi:MAG: AMP-binding protein, partial [Planctomycetes bacterium]|nr:AMP-binding protein [Planctomycetota bacterium]
NVLVYAGIGAGAASAALLAQLGLSTRAIFVVAGVALLAGGAAATVRAPQALVRLVLFLLTHTVYRLRVHGRAHVPESGGALLVPNHVSFIDGLLVIASLDRPVRFLVDASFFERPLLGRALQWFGAIPISSAGGPKMILRAFRDAGRHLDDGHLVCIFAEGQITRNGLLNPFRRGLERIVKGRSAPIVPVHLDGVWGSIFSYSGGRFVRKLPERVPYPVQVSFGPPLPSTTPIHAVRRAVMELGSEAWCARRPSRRPLHHAFLAQVRRAPWRLLFADAKTKKVSRLRAAAGAIALARALRQPLGDARNVGILLPSSIGAALCNLALALSGRTSVNLNFTAGKAALDSAARQAGLRHVLTSAEFLAKAKVDLPEGAQPLFVDELLARLPAGERIRGALLALFAPKRWIEQACGAARPVTPDDLVTVLFSSGSTGEPKGVMLSHFNVDANVAALVQSFRTTSDDRLLGILPLFHSFGFTATLWFPACQGLSTVFHPNPIDAAAVGALVERHRVTFLLATPTLLSIWMRRVTPAQFGSLRLVLTGAEKLSEAAANAFHDQFGIRPLEGYGATECAPLIAASTHDFRAPGFWQPGWRRGSVGQPAPGVALRIVHPETFALLDPGEEGLLLVRGPNVMEGYLGRPDLTEKALRDGWYVTGDLARLDGDGFLTLTDRLARFSKIGGEMVPHGRIEEELHKAAGAVTPTFAVTALPDAKKGERLAVIHTTAPERVPELLAKLAAAGLPNLFLPRADHFVQVAALPLLGTGKMDLRGVKKLAEAALTDAAAEPAVAATAPGTGRPVTGGATPS